MLPVHCKRSWLGMHLAVGFTAPSRGVHAELCISTREIQSSLSFSLVFHAKFEAQHLASAKHGHCPTYLFWSHFSCEKECRYLAIGLAGRAMAAYSSHLAAFLASGALSCLHGGCKPERLASDRELSGRSLKQVLVCDGSDSPKTRKSIRYPIAAPLLSRIIPDELV